MKVKYGLLLILVTCVVGLRASAQDAKAIVKRAEEKLRGESSKSELLVEIIRPTWQRQMTVKNWSKGDELAVILITSPAKDAGTAFLKRGNEIWNWVPSIERSIKLPPSMMGQSWMGTDLTNDDLVEQSSMEEDYQHKIAGEETVSGRKCWEIVMTPKPDAPVVWGKIRIWIDQEAYMQLKTEFYDEYGDKVNTMLGEDISTFDGKRLPARLVIIPADEEGHKTVMTYKELAFDIDINDRFFSLQNIKNLR